MTLCLRQHLRKQLLKPAKTKKNSSEEKYGRQVESGEDDKKTVKTFAYDLAMDKWKYLSFKRSAVSNQTLLSPGVCGSAVSAQSGRTEEGGGGEGAARCQHQDRQTDGKGCASTHNPRFIRPFR